MLLLANDGGIHLLNTFIRLYTKFLLDAENKEDINDNLAYSFLYKQKELSNHWGVLRLILK